MIPYVRMQKKCSFACYCIFIDAFVKSIVSFIWKYEHIIKQKREYNKNKHIIVSTSEARMQE